ncbi:hypothetical protein KY334_05395 [Candidatus Woesearchaeota archaeon]|nr:hypothetical protein [Candidatus Woesearchaeota archaeon]
MSDIDRYKSQIVDAIKGNLPDTGPAPEKNMSALISNREYDKNLTACGKRVALSKHERLHERIVGDIIVPTSEEVGKNLNKATILSLGKDAEKYNLKKGDIVLYDHFSVYYDHHPNVVTDVVNIICKYDGDKPIPVGNYVHVKTTDIMLDKEPEGIILLEDSKLKCVFEVVTIGTGVEDYKFDVKPGDKILIGGDPMRDVNIILDGQKTLFVDVRNIEAFVID